MLLADAAALNAPFTPGSIGAVPSSAVLFNLLSRRGPWADGNPYRSAVFLGIACFDDLPLAFCVFRIFIFDTKGFCWIPLRVNDHVLDQLAV
jgi:hypothetical protein